MKTKRRRGGNSLTQGLRKIGVNVGPSTLETAKLIKQKASEIKDYQGRKTAFKYILGDPRLKDINVPNLMTDLLELYKKPKVGGNWITQSLRNVGMYSSLSTSEVARKINEIMSQNLNHEEKDEKLNELFKNYDSEKLNANYTNIMRDLKVLNSDPVLASYITQKLVGMPLLNGEIPYSTTSPLWSQDESHFKQ
jgi:hypothetical protein